MIRPFKYERSYGWLFWLIGGIMIAAFAVSVVTRITGLMETAIAVGLFALAACEMVSGCAIDKSFVASIARRESPFLFWLSIAFKAIVAIVILIESRKFK